MSEDASQVEWQGRQAIVRFVRPESTDPFRDQVAAAVGGGARVVIIDLSGMLSCDHAEAEALAWAHRRVVTGGALLRLVAPAPGVRRVLSLEGLDRLAGVYGSVPAALSDGEPVGPVLAPAGEAAGEHGPGTISGAVLWQVIEALGDGLALVASDGEIVLASRRCAEMFGYTPAELTGQPVEILVPDDLAAAHRRLRDGYLRSARPLLMGDRAPLPGRRKDGATIPVTISLSPVTTSNGALVLAVVREAGQPWRGQDLAGLARAVAADRDAEERKLLDRVVAGLFRVGMSLQAAAGLPGEEARERIAAAISELDDTIADIRERGFARGGRSWPPAAGQR